MSNRPKLRQFLIGLPEIKRNLAILNFSFCVHLFFSIVFLTIFLSLNSSKVFAAPLYNIPQTLIQPDNTEINCFASGDEFFNYYHDADGYLIIKDDETGYYTYAQIIDGDIVASNDVVASSSSEQNNATRNSRITVSDIPQALIEEKYVLSGAYDDLPEMNMGADEQERRQNRSFTPANQFINKTLQNLVIFIKFDDTDDYWPSADDAVTYSDFLLGTNGGLSLQGYINEVSYGKTQINSILGGPTYDLMYQYKAEENRSFYLDNQYGRSRRIELLEKACEDIKNKVPSNVNLDSNNDGLVDCITFIVWGEDATGAFPTFWPHRYHLVTDTLINGKQVYDYNLQIQDLCEDYRVFAHEMLHVLGFPDQYRRQGFAHDNPIGTWDMMCAERGHPNAHTKYKYGGWIDEIAEITSPGRYTINPLTCSTNNSMIIRSPFDSNEYVMVEYRKKEGSYESFIPGTGLLIYKINPSKRGNYYATSADPKGKNCEVFAYRPMKGSYAQVIGGITFGNYLYANFSSDVGRPYANSFNSDPILEYDNGVNSSIFISNIGTAGDTISFDVRFQLFSDSRVEQAVRTAINKPSGDLSLSDLEQVTELSITGNTTDVDLGGVECLNNLEKITFYGNSYVQIKNNDFSYVNGFNYDSLSVVTSGISLSSVYVTINKINPQNNTSTTESNSVSLINGMGTYSPVSSITQLSNTNEHLELLIHLDSDHDVLISKQIVQPVLFEF